MVSWILSKVEEHRERERERHAGEKVRELDTNNTIQRRRRRKKKMGRYRSAM